MTSPGGDRRVRIVIAADVAQAIQSMRQVADATDNVGRQAQQAQQRSTSWSDALKTGLGVVGVQAGFQGIVGGLKSVTSNGLDYERTMNQMRAVTGASADQMAQIADTAKKLGGDITIPGASAQTAAAAMTELAKGGLSAQQAMDASRGTMILAAAAQIDGAQAAQIQASALNTFGLKADQAGRVANVLANVANQSSGEIGDFAQGLAQAGTVAASFGWDIESTTDYLGLMANAGIRGSDAGTSLKTTLTAMLSPTKAQAEALAELGIQTRDSSGNMISARDLTEQLAAAKGRMSTADFNAAAATAFGTDAVRTALVAADAGTEGYDKMAAALGNVNGAQDVAAANSKGLSGIVDSLKNTVDSASLSLFEALTPALSELTPAITSVVTPLSDGLAPLLAIVADTATGTLAPALEAAAGLIGAIADPLADVIGFLNGLPGPMGAAALAVAGLVLYRGPIAGLWTNLTTGMASARAQTTTFAGSLRAASGAMATTQVAAKGLMGALGGPIGLAILGVSTALSFMGGKQEDVTVQTTGLSAALDEQTGKFKANADAIIARAAADGGSFDAYEKIGGSVEEYTQALLQNEAAQEGVHTRLLDQATAAVEASDGYGRMIAKGAILPGTARDIASELLATGDAGQYGGQGLEAVIDASNRFASDSGQITDAQRQNRQATEASTEAAKANAGEIAGMADASTAATGAVDGASAASTTAAEAFKAHADALKQVTDTAKLLAENTPLSSYLTGVKTAADDANRSMDYFKALQDDLTGKTRSLNDAVSAQNGALASVAAAFDAGTKAATENTEAGNLNVDALRNWDVNALTATSDGRSMYDQLTRLADQHVNTANAAYQDAVQHGNVAGAADVARAAADQNRQKFLELADQYGITGSDADALADKLGIVAGADQVGQRQSALRALTDTEWSGIGSRIQTVTSGQVVPAWEQVQSFADATGAFFAGVNAGIGSATDQATADLGTIRGALDEFFKLVDGRAGSSSNSTASVTVSASGTQALADGGLITSGTGPRSDDVIVRASKGEYVVNAAATARNKPLLDSINYGGAYADGGLISESISTPLQNVITTGAQKAITGGVEQVIKALTPTFSAAFNGAVPEGARGAFLNAVLSKQGTSYVWGAAGPDVFDCSGLMSWGLQQAGVGKGRLTAAQFGDSFPRSNPEKPGDLALFDTGRVSPKAGHIGAVLDPAAGTMMHTDGAGPARISPYRSRAGLMGFIDAIGGSYVPAASKAEGAAGDPPAANWLQATLDRIETGTSALTTMASNVAYSPGGGAEQWTSTILQALQILGEPPAYEPIVRNQVRTESGGNPRAWNKWDRNFPLYGGSKGLAQVIDPTFQTYAIPPYDKDIWDPLSNLLAGMNYARHEYGSIPAGMRGVAYDSGGPLKPGYTLAYNGTGGDEMALTKPQWNTAARAINAVTQGGGGGGVVRVEFGGDGAITQAMLDTATVTIDGKLAEVARLTTLAGSQR